jgi:hypothetical protein
MTESIRIVVYCEHTIGFIRHGSRYIEILHTSVLRGSSLNPHSSSPVVDESKCRHATLKDFEEFRVCAEGYIGDATYVFDRRYKNKDF